MNKTLYPGQEIYCGPKLGQAESMVLNELVSEADGLRAYASEVAALAVDIVCRAVGSAQNCENCIGVATRGYDGLYGDIARNLRDTKAQLEAIYSELKRL